MNYELFGIAGTVLILIGFLSNSEKKIRIFDMAGSALFVLYGILIHALSNVLLNGILIVVHIVKLYKMGKRRGTNGTGEETSLPHQRTTAP